MTHICCPRCVGKLMYGVDGSNINTKCSICKTQATVSFNNEELHLVFKAKYQSMLKDDVIHIACPNCGHEIMTGVDGDRVNTKCSKCRTSITVSFNEEEIHIFFKSFGKTSLKKK